MGQFDKADGLRKVAKVLDKPLALALGIAQTMRPCSSAADVAVVIQSSKSVAIQVDAPVVLRPQHPGPQGWADACAAWWQVEGSLNVSEYQLSQRLESE